jgi:hypothetical protein
MKLDIILHFHTLPFIRALYAWDLRFPTHYHIFSVGFCLPGWFIVGS